MWETPLRCPISIQVVYKAIRVFFLASHTAMVFVTVVGCSSAAAGRGTPSAA